MKLEVGMIARTNKGLLIDIIHDFDSELCAYKRDEITKASFNLIDLIEVGDYDNGEIVKEVYIADELNKKDSCIEILEEYLYVDDIKELLTHEQYNANKYVVGSE